MKRANMAAKGIVVIGALHLDDIAQPCQPLVNQASNPVMWKQRVGGVAVNAACAAVRALQTPSGVQIELMAAVGDDSIAKQLQQALRTAGVHTRLIEYPSQATGRYTAIMTHEGELHIGLADVSLAERLGESTNHGIDEVLKQRAVLVDANLSEQYLIAIANQTITTHSPLAAMSVSPAKSKRLLPIAARTDILFCNRREALAMNAHLPANTSLNHLADGLCQAGFTQIVLTDGNSPLLIQDERDRVSLNVPMVESPHNVNGAGDALAGASYAAWTNGMKLIPAVQEVGLKQAAMVVSGDFEAPKINSSIT